jgi:hypothetical protein
VIWPLVIRWIDRHLGHECACGECAIASVNAVVAERARDIERGREQ